MQSPNRWNRLICFAAASLLAACASQSTDMPSASERRADVYLQTGVDALERRDYTGALRNFNDALKQNPKSAMV